MRSSNGLALFSSQVWIRLTKRSPIGARSSSYRRARSYGAESLHQSAFGYVAVKGRAPAVAQTASASSGIGDFLIAPLLPILRF